MANGCYAVSLWLIVAHGCDELPAVDKAFVET